MTCKTHLLDKIHQVVFNNPLTELKEKDTTIKFVFIKKKGFYGKTLKGKKVKLVRNEVWKEV